MSATNQFVTIKTTGNVGIGTESLISGAKFQVHNATDKNLFVGNNSQIGWINDAGTAWQQTDLNGSTITFGTGNSASEAMRITSTGNVGIASTTPWRTLGVTGTVGFDGLTAGAGAGRSVSLPTRRSPTAPGRAAPAPRSASSTTSRRSTPPAASTTVLKLNPVSFVYNDDIGVKGPQVGLIAEQVQQVEPRLVATDASGTPFTVKYENLTASSRARFRNSSRSFPIWRTPSPRSPTTSPPRN